MRRLVVLFDGTWNEPRDWTNVQRLSEAIDQGAVEEGVEQVVKYCPGVGTSWYGKLLGATMGFGLSKIIKEAYQWLSKRYKEGDEVYVFGFSRGAYSARSFVSLLHKCRGVLRPEKCSNKHVEEAYDLYRDEGVKIYDEKMKLFAKENSRPVRVRMIGVWDTVGALGIPNSAFQAKTFFRPLMAVINATTNSNRDHYVFHGQGLPCIVDEAYHALAIDEHRKDFAPTLWTDMKQENKVMQQCWFVGSHSNVGGGVMEDDLWELSYEWMQDKALALGLRFRYVYRAEDQWPHWRTNPEPSYKNMVFGLYSKFNPIFTRKLGTEVGEILHPSVVERIKNSKGTYCPLGVKGTGNYPDNIITVLPYKEPLRERCSCHGPPKKGP